VEAAGPSRTALRVALRRAAHQVYDAKPLVFEDALAVRILGAEFADELKKTETRIRKPASAAPRAFLVARSRYVEDCLATAYGRGVRQYCLLGAGLDTFGCRNSYAGLRVFEVDHPATQIWKRGLLERNGIRVPESLTFVPVDFEQESVEDRLVASGFEMGAPAFFGWLGVVPYLTEGAFRGTLGFIAGRPAGSGVVMDYGQPREALPLLDRMERDSLAARVALAGEPFRLFFTPEGMAKELAGFGAVADLGAEELNRHYFGEREDGLRVRGAAGRVACAWVA